MLRIKLVAARVNAGYNQREMAELLGVSRSTIQSWEQYKTSPDVLQAQKLSEIYNIPLSNIIFFNENLA